jgi:hypothetical protein
MADFAESVWRSAPDTALPATKPLAQTNATPPSRTLCSSAAANPKVMEYLVKVLPNPVRVLLRIIRR